LAVKVKGKVAVKANMKKVTLLQTPDQAREAVDHYEAPAKTRRRN
jgi:hypothetical protein